MIPSFLCLLFQIITLLVTGLYPAHHGLVGNAMFDAKKNESYSLSNRKGGGRIARGMRRHAAMGACGKTANAMHALLVGSEAAVQGTQANLLLRLQRCNKMDDRIAAVKNGWNCPKHNALT